MIFKRLLSAVTLTFAVAAQAGAADHLYQLNGSLADSLGGPALTAYGGTLGADRYSFGADQGLSLAYALGGVYTIDLAFRFDAPYASSGSIYQKIIDFNSLTNDAGLYARSGSVDLYPATSTAPLLSAGLEQRLTMTRNAAALVTLYVGGVEVLRYADISGLANFGANLATFFRDDTITGRNEAGAGSIDYLRTFDRALSATEVARLASAVPEPGTTVMFGAGLALLGLAARRKANA